MPATQSVDMSALTPSAGLSGYDDLVQVLYDGANLSDDMVQSLYEYKANIVNPSDGMYVSQLLLVKTQHLSQSEVPRPRTSSRRGRAQRRLRNLSDLSQHHKYLLPKRQQPNAH